MIPDERDLAWIVGRVRSGFDATAVYLFGSHAKGTPRPGSDIDLLIVGPSRLPRVRRGREVAAALAAFPTRFDLLFYTDEELSEERADPRSFISTVMASAQILYRREAQRAPNGDSSRAIGDRGGSAMVSQAQSVTEAGRRR